MKIYEFWGMKRSGNHAITNWIIQNILNCPAKKVLINNDPHDFYCNGLLYINCYHTASYKIENLRTGLKLKPDILLITYEDEPTTYSALRANISKKFVICRDIKNLVASRVANKYEKMCIDDLFFNAWEEHIRSPIEKIVFNKWLFDKNYRNKICADMEIHNLDITDSMSTEGGGSSFTMYSLGNKENLLNRANQITLPDSIHKKILYYEHRNKDLITF